MSSFCLSARPMSLAQRGVYRCTDQLPGGQCFRATPLHTATMRRRRRGSEGDQDKARGTGRLRRHGAERAAREREAERGSELGYLHGSPTAESFPRRCCGAVDAERSRPLSSGSDTLVATAHHQRDRKTDRKTNRPTDRPTDRQTHTHERQTKNERTRERRREGARPRERARERESGCSPSLVISV